MFDENDETTKPTLKEFYEATRAPADMGTYKTFQIIMNRMGHVADKTHYIQIRQEGRQHESKSKSTFDVGFGKSDSSDFDL